MARRATSAGGVRHVSLVIGTVQALAVPAIGEVDVQLEARGRRITLWGVTDLLRRLLDDWTLPKMAVVVDVDPRRRTHLEAQGVEVFQPHEQRDHVRESDLLVFCAPRYRDQIVELAARQSGRRFSGSVLEVLGAGEAGESLL